MSKRSISSRKRVRQSARRQEHNKARRSELKTQVRKFVEAVATGKPDAAAAAFKETAAVLDRAGARGTIHRNTASRKKSRLAKRLNAIKGAKK